MCMCECVCLSVFVCECLCACVCVCVYVFVSVYVHILQAQLGTELTWPVIIFFLKRNTNLANNVRMMCSLVVYLLIAKISDLKNV